MIKEQDRNLLLQLEKQLKNQENTNIIVGGNRDIKNTFNGLSININLWKFPKILEMESRSALKPYVKPQLLLAVKVEQSNISVPYSKGNMCLQYIDVYTVDPKKPRLFYSMKLDHVWVSHSWVSGAMTRKNLEHGDEAPLYLAAMAHEYEDAYNNVKYGLRAPYYHVLEDLNEYQIVR